MMTCKCNARCCLECEMAIRKELDEWRSGKRRIWWRVKFNSDHIFTQLSFHSPPKRGQYEAGNGKVFRVTVRPKGAKR